MIPTPMMITWALGWFAKTKTSVQGRVQEAAKSLAIYVAIGAIMISCAALVLHSVRREAIAQTKLHEVARQLELQSEYQKHVQELAISLDRQRQDSGDDLQALQDDLDAAHGRIRDLEAAKRVAWPEAVVRRYLGDQKPSGKTAQGMPK